MAIILFTYFQETTAGAVPSLVGRENLLRRVRFPRLVVPLSVALFCLFNLGMNLSSCSSSSSPAASRRCGAGSS